MKRSKKMARAKRTWADGRLIPDELFENDPLDRTRREVEQILQREFDDRMRRAGLPARPKGN